MTVTTLQAQPVAQAPLSYRKNVAMLRGPQLATLRSAYRASMQLSDDRGWQHWAGIHGLPLPMYCQHHTPLFLAWHRAYLYYFELSLQLSPTVTLPWWDWTSSWSHQVGFPVSYTVAEAGGEPNPLAPGGPINALAQQQGGAGAPGHTSRSPDDPANLPRPRRSTSCWPWATSSTSSSSSRASTTACMSGRAAPWRRSPTPPTTRSSSPTTA